MSAPQPHGREAQAPPSPAGAVRARKNWIWFAVMAALLGWTAYTVLRQQTPGQLFRSLIRADWRFLVLGLLVMAAFIGFEARASQLILRALGSPQGYRRCYMYSCAGFFFSNITPSATGGQPAQICYMKRDGVSVAHGCIDMLLVTICYHTAAVIFGVLSLLLFPALPEVLGGRTGFLLGFGLAVYLIMDVGMILFLFLPGPVRRVARWGLGLLGRLRPGLDRAGLEGALEEQLLSYAQGAALIRSSPLLLPRTLLLIAGQLACSYAIPWLVCLSFHLTGVGFFEVFALQTLCAIAVGYLPLPGSAGAAENVFLHAFVFIFGSELVAPAMILCRYVSCYLVLAATGLVTARMHFSKKDRVPAP